MNRALFLDRDGVINEDYGYVHKIEDFHFREGIFDVCRAAHKARMKIIVVTNQAGIGRFLYSPDQYQHITGYMIDKFGESGINISGVYHCPYHAICGIGHFKSASYNRKPYPGMLVTACNEHSINPLLSIMIGDKNSDKSAASAIGIKIYLDATNANWIQEAIRVLSL